MRPKDADKLVRWLETNKSNANPLDYNTRAIFAECITMVETMETLDVEPVRHARWEWYEEPYDSRNPDGNYGWRCSACKQDLAAELTLGIPHMHYAYDILDDPAAPPTLIRCLFCGAKMDAKEE